MGVSVFGCQYGNFIISQKYYVSFMCFLSFVILYGTRYGLATCFPYLNRKARELGNDTETCPGVLSLNDSHDFHLTDKITWSYDEFHIISCGFYVGYGIAHLGGGIGSDLLGAKFFVSSGVLGSSVCSVGLAAILTRVRWEIIAVVEFVHGCFQGLTMPGIMTLLAYWTPTSHLTTLVSFTHAGGPLGNAMNYLIAAHFIHEKGNWNGLYIFWAIAGVIWYIVFTFTVFSTPATHAFMCEKERLALQKEFGTLTPKRIPYFSIVADKATWALTSGQMGHNILSFVIKANLPLFFKIAMGVEVEKKPYLVFIPFMSQCIASVCFGYLADYLIRRQKLAPVYVRSIYLVMGNVLSSFFILFATLMHCNQILVVSSIVLALIMQGAVFPGLKTNIIDRTRYYAGSLTIVENGFTFATTPIANLLVNKVCEHQIMSEWRKLYWFSIALSIFASFIYIMWAKSTRARWDIIKTEEELRQQKLRGRVKLYNRHIQHSNKHFYN